MKKEILDDNLKLISQLRDTPTLKFFEKRDISKISRFSKVVTYRAGEKILEQNSYDNWVYFLLSGEIRIVKGHETIDVLKRTGDIFGEMCIIDGEPRSASAYAVGDVTCLATDVSFIDNLYPEEKTAFSAVFFQILAETLAKRLRETSEELVKAREEIASLKKK